MALVIKSDVAVAKDAVNDNDLNIQDFKTAAELKSEYRARVLADGGRIVDDTYLTQVCEFLALNKLAGRVNIFCSARLGVKRLTSNATSKELIEKIYSLVDASGDLSYRLLEVPVGADTANTVVSDITSVITAANATDSNCPELITNSGKPHITLSASAITRSISFYQKNPNPVTVAKTIGVALIHQPSQTYTTDNFPISLTDSENIAANGGSNDFTFRMLVKPATTGTASSLIARVSTVGTTTTNGLHVQQVDRTMLESPVGSDRVAMIYANSPERTLGMGYRVNGVYSDKTSTHSTEFSEGLRKVKSVSIGGDVAKEFRRFPGNLYDLVVMRDLSFEKMKLVRDFLQSKL